MAHNNDPQFPPWLSYASREAHFDSLSEEYEDELVALLAARENLSGAAFVELLEGRHLVLAIPKGPNNGVAFVHHVTSGANVYLADQVGSKVEGVFLGLTGFAGIAPLMMFNNDIFDEALATKVRVPKQLAETKVPSLEAMLKAYQAKENILDIRNEEGVSVQKWRERQLVQVWEPQLLEKVAEVHKHWVDPLDVIMGVLDELLDRMDLGQGLAEPPLLHHWENNLKALWVKAFLKNSNTVVIMEPYADSGADDYHQKLFRQHLYGSEEEDDRKRSPGRDRGEREKVAEEQGETGRSLEDMIAEATRIITEGVVKNVAGLKRRQDGEAEEAEREPKRSANVATGEGRATNPVAGQRAGPPLREGTAERRAEEGSEQLVIMTLLNENMRMMKEVVEGASKTNEGMLRAFTSVLSESVDMRREEQADKKKERHGESLLGDWTEKDKKLFELLSATDWDEPGVPELNEFAKALVTGKKKVTRGIRMVQHEAEVRQWQGTVIRFGLSKFLREGFRAEDIVEAPGGISPFSCQPASFVNTRSIEEEKQFMQDNFGNGKLNEEVLNALAKKVWYIPVNMHEAIEMVETLVQLLDLLTNERSIASEGYRFGLEAMKKNKRMFAVAEWNDDLFLVKFLYLLDTTFQSFCKRLLTWAEKENPIQAAARKLEGYQGDVIYDAIKKTMSHGVVPADLPVPLLFQRGISADEGELRGADLWKETKKERDQPGKVGANQHPDWFKKNPNPEPTWELPVGRTFGGVFGGDIGKENQKGFPKFKHHMSGKAAFLCMAYQVKGNCKRGASCFNSHIPPPKMTEAEKKKVSNRLKEVYAKV